MVNQNNDFLVTIAVPTFNRAHLVKSAVDSALRQTHQNLEVLIVDNGSSDNTSQIVGEINDSRVRFIRNECNIGVAGNWQKCVDKSSGDYLLILSDDDVLEPRAISILLEPYLRGIPSLDIQPSSVSLSIGRSKVILPDGSLVDGPSQNTYLSNNDYISSCLGGRVAYYPSASLMRLSDVKKLGGFCTDKYKYAIDVVLATRLGSLAGVAFNDNVVVNYRDHDAGVTNNLPLVSIVDETLKYSNLCKDLLLKSNTSSKIRYVDELVINFKARRIFSLILINRGARRSDRIRYLYSVRKYAVNVSTMFVLVNTFILILLPARVFSSLRKVRSKYNKK